MSLHLKNLLNIIHFIFSEQKCDPQNHKITEPQYYRQKIALTKTQKPSALHALGLEIGGGPNGHVPNKTHKITF